MARQGESEFGKARKMAGRQSLLGCIVLLSIVIPPTAEALTVDQAPSACVGTQMSDFTMSSSIRLVKMMRGALQGCQYVIGDVYIIGINEQEFIDSGVPFDMSFLDTIKEITGCIKIVGSCFNTPISFKSLQVIRGQHCGSDTITVHFEDSCTMRIPPIDFRNLSYISTGHVLTGGLRDCYMEKRVNFSELFADRTNQSFKSKLPCLDKDAECHKDCPVWPHGRQHCWGPGPDQCQLMTKCRKAVGCPFNRCFEDRGSEQCCSENCLGGCLGRSSSQCRGCAMFNKDGTCVSACSPSKVYDHGMARLVEPQEKYYPLGSICVAKCPNSFFVQEDSCVSKCSTGYSADSSKMCVKVPESRHCEGGNSAMICGIKNPLLVPRGNVSQLCTEFTGDISIIDACFGSVTPPGMVKLKVEDLAYIFSRLTIVRGRIFVTLSTPVITNLSFLSNLQRIDKNPRTPQSGYLQVSSTFVQYLGLSSLHYVVNGIIVVPNPADQPKGGGNHLCPNLFPKEKAATDKLIIHPAPFPHINASRLFERLRSGYYVPLCPIVPQECHRDCDQSYGCWGPFAYHCLRCQHAKAGSQCVPDCTTADGWFQGAQNRTLNPEGSVTEQLCSRCAQLCSKCFGPNGDQCTGCISTAYRDGTRCVEQCSTDHQFADANRVCQSCPNVCVNPKSSGPTCTGSGAFVGLGGCQFCTRVIPEIGRDGARMLRCLSASQSCPAGFYVAVLDPSHVTEFPDFLQIVQSTTLSVSICLRCADHCEQCSEAAGLCTKCLHYQVKSRQEISAHTGLKCTTVRQCPSGYYSSEDNSTCRQCTELCSECSGPTDADCTKCGEHMYTHFTAEMSDNSTQSASFSCVRSCPESHSHVILRGNYGMACSSSPASSIVEKESIKAAKMTTVLIGVVISFLFLVIFLVVFCYWVRQRAIRSKNCPRKGIIGWDEDMEPLNVTDAAPNVAVLRTISEKEISRGQEVGSGAFGTVFRGDWWPEGENRKVSVAIKILSDSLGDGCVAVELLEESRIMASVEHPHCVRLVGICMTQPLQLITQFMPLGNLRDFLRARKDGDQIGSSHLLRYAAQIASGMGYLEQRNIIHRDLACRNVLVASAKSVKITDFGLAKLLDSPNDEYISSGGRLPVKWLALECLISCKFSHKSDVWAYGVTLWEIFTFGDAPYVNVKPNDLADYLEKGERLPQPPICTLDVYILLIKCWMLNESQRPTFDELEANFKKMAMDPGRYVYIKGDKYARNPSNESGSTEHRSVSSSQTPSVNQAPSETAGTGPMDPEDCNYSALDAAAAAVNGGPSSSRQQPRAVGARACSSQKYVNVSKKKARLSSSHNDNKYTSDPCKSSLEEHPVPAATSQQQLDDDYLRPIGASGSCSSPEQSRASAPPPPPPPPLPPHPFGTSTVQNPEYFFNASRRQYHNLSAASPAQSAADEDQGDDGAAASVQPLQVWVSAPRQSSSNGAADDESNVNYV